MTNIKTKKKYYHLMHHIDAKLTGVGTSELLNILTTGNSDVEKDLRQSIFVVRDTNLGEGDENVFELIAIFAPSQILAAEDFAEMMNLKEGE